MSHKRIIGSRPQVWHGTAKKTPGGLTKADLMMNKHGRIVSRAKHSSAKKEMRLLKHGYGTKKGKFGYVKIGKKGSKRMRGGYSMNALMPANASGSYMIKDVVPQKFSPLDYALEGGRRRRGRSMRKSRYMRGGYEMNALMPASVSGMDITGYSGMAGMPGSGIDGQGITDYGMNGSDSVQIAAGQAGGRRRRSMYRGKSMRKSMYRGKSMRKSMRKGRSMRGGTGTVNPGGFGLGVAEGSPMNLALNAA
jgi:hypothetical protein